MRKTEALHLRSVIEQSAQSLPDDVALTVVNFHPAWTVNTTYAVDFKVQYGGILYRCLTEHTSQADWTPAAAPSLWAKILIPDANVVPEWEQPDSTNPYMKGDRVIYNGKTWESTIDNNIWAPDAYGWVEVTE